MTLGQKQRKFTKMVALLVQYAELLGYELTYGDAWAFDGHKEDSFHYRRLAVDFNLFINGVYQRSTKAHEPLGKFWKFIGGTWGGDFKRKNGKGGKDGNHYSYTE